MPPATRELAAGPCNGATPPRPPLSVHRPDQPAQLRHHHTRPPADVAAGCRGLLADGDATAFAGRHAAALSRFTAVRGQAGSARDDVLGRACVVVAELRRLVRTVA